MDNLLTDSTWEDDDSKRQPITRKAAEYHEQVFTMWEAGIRDLEEISIETGYAVNYVKFLLRNRGFDVTQAPLRKPEEIVEILADYNAGMAIRKICRKHSISNNALYTILDESDTPTRRSGGSPRKQEFMDRAVELYQQGEAIKRIMSETGIAPPALYSELDERGISLRIQPDIQDTVIERAVALYIEGRKIDDINVETGVGSSKLYQVLEARGVPVRRSPDFVDRMDTAVALYERGADISTIFQETKIGSQQLYRELRHRGIAMRNGKRAKGANVPLALDLYDKGESFLSIQRQSGITLLEMTNVLVQRGLNLRTGLPPRKIKSSLDVAIQEYNDGIPEEDITIDTLVTKVQLLAALHEKGIELRP